MPAETYSLFNKHRLLTPGPTPLPEQVRLALATDMLHHRKDKFKQIMAKTQSLLKILFGTQNPVLPLACSGTGAMTAAVYSLFVPGEKVLVVEAGKFGQRWKEIAQARGLEIISETVKWGETPDPGKIAELLHLHPDIKGVLLQLCETSTGALLPVREIAKITTKLNILSVVDGISGVGISPCPMDEWELDCLLTGSQKGLMVPPGLGLISLSGKAWSKAETIEPGCFYFNLSAEKANILKNQTNFTTPVNLIMGLCKSLELLLQNGLENIYRKQWALTALVRQGAASMGLEPLLKNHFSWGVTAIKLPDAIDGTKILSLIQNQYGIIMAGGQDELKGKIIRIGHMGWVDWADCLAGLTALGEVLKNSARIKINMNFAASAIDAYQQALSEYPRF